MTLRFSNVLPAQARGQGSVFSVRSLALDGLAEDASPLVAFDDFDVGAHIFGSHPHAGFSAVTYVLEDSAGGVRSRDSLGNDIVVGPGGIVWTQAGRGMLHEEMPAAEGGRLHGLQLFVNLSARNKFASPRVYWLGGDAVPEWHGAGGNRVRVVVGSHAGITSPLAPIEPFTLLDVTVESEVVLDIPDAHNALLYVLEGVLRIAADGLKERLTSCCGLVIHSDGGRLQCRAGAARCARFVVAYGARQREPVLMQGPFIMNDYAQIEDAVRRFQVGQMGHLPPV